MDILRKFWLRFSDFVFRNICEILCGFWFFRSILCAYYSYVLDELFLRNFVDFLAQGIFPFLVLSTERLRNLSDKENKMKK